MDQKCEPLADKKKGRLENIDSKGAMKGACIEGQSKDFNKRVSLEMTVRLKKKSLLRVFDIQKGPRERKD